MTQFGQVKKEYAKRERKIVPTSSFVCLFWVEVVRPSQQPCADPEGFVRGGPTLTFFFFVFVFLIRGGRIQIPLKAGHCWPAAEMPLKWHSEGEQMMAQH